MTDQEKEAENVAVEKLYQHKRRVRLINAILLFIFVEGFIGLYVLIAGATSGHGDPSSIVLLLAPIILLVLYLRIFNSRLIRKFLLSFSFLLFMVVIRVENYKKEYYKTWY